MDRTALQHQTEAYFRASHALRHSDRALLCGAAFDTVAMIEASAGITPRLRLACTKARRNGAINVYRAQRGGDAA